MKIGIKYCGGCNPRYDRVQIVSRLREDFPGLELFPAREDSPADLIVVICGCGVQCANHARLHGAWGKMILSRAEDYDVLCKKIREILQKQEETL